MKLELTSRWTTGQGRREWIVGSECNGRIVE